MTQRVSDTPPPIRSYLLILPKQFHHLGTKYSNVGAYDGHFHSNYQGGEGKDLFKLINPSSGEVMARNQSRNLEVGTEAVAKEECYLLACSSWVAQSAFLYNPGLPDQ